MLKQPGSPAAGIAGPSPICRLVGEGCRNAAELHRELIAAGLTASYYSVRRCVRRRLVVLGRDSQEEVSAGGLAPRVPSAKQLSFMIIRKPEERDEEEQFRVETLTGIDEELSNALELIAMFAARVRGVLKFTLKDWLTKADASECVEIRGFAMTLRQDEGRAGFELLRARVRAA